MTRSGDKRKSGPKPRVTPRVARLPKPAKKNSGENPPVGRARAILVAIAWAIGALIAVSAPSYVLYEMDRPDVTEPTVGEDLVREISSYFSFGFDRVDLSDAITLEQDEAMSLRWRRISDGGLQATFRLGLYSVRDAKTTARFVAMVPASAKLFDCSYSDATTAVSNLGVGYAPPVKTQCAESSSGTARFFSAPLVPNGNAKGLFYLNLSFVWDEPSITNLGVGREAIHLRYQGRFPLDPAGAFVPADQAKVQFDLSNSGHRSGLPPGVHLEYETTKAEAVTKATPEPDSTSDDMSIWISSPDRPTYLVTILVERPGQRRIFDLAGQGIFLIIGAILGAMVPKLQLLRKRQPD